MRKARVLVAAVVMLVAGGAAAPAGARQDPPEGVQIVVVLDVSGSMEDFVFSEEIPAEIRDVIDQIADLEDQLLAIEADPQLAALEDQIDQAESDPDLVAAEEAFDAASLATRTWLSDQGFGDGLADVYTAVQEGLAELGCNEWLMANIVKSADFEEVDTWLDVACPGVDLSEEQRQSIYDLVPFIDDAEYQALNAAEGQTFAAFDALRIALGISELDLQAFQLREQLGYFDIQDQVNTLEADVDDLARRQGFSIKLELAQLAVETLLDLSRLDQVAGDLDTSMALAIFSKDAELRREFTADLDAISDAVARLRPLETTNLGGGLTVALDELERVRDPQRPAAIILLSDGRSNEGMPIADILAQIPQRAGDLEATICSAGFATTEDEVDADLLRGLADETDGEYLFVTRGEELTSFFLACRQGLLGSVVERITGVASAEPREAGRIDVPANSCELSAVVSFLDVVPDVRLLDPSGAPAEAEAQQGDNVRLLTVQDPAAGSWVAEVTSPEGDRLFSLVLSTQECAEPATTTTAAAATTTEAVTATAAAAGAESGGGGGAGPILVIVIVVLAVGGAALVFVLRRRSAGDR